MLKKLIIFMVLLCASLPVFGQSVDTAWVRRYNGPANASDYGLAITMDSFGNIYVAGNSKGVDTFDDYVTIKYYPNGDTAWVRRYNGLGNSDDWVFGMSASASGNVYVTGQSYGIGSYMDYVTIKYYSNGDTGWVRRYNGPGNEYDRACAITVDDFENVYVTGFSDQKSVYPNNKDYATIKYYPNGDTAWVRRYNGTGNSDDIPWAIAVDGSENVYVTGMSVNSEGYMDYLTIKYQPNGDTAWVRRYNGIANSYDNATAIALDSYGNAYVTGSGSGDQAGFAYGTIKYYPDGDTAWVRIYNELGNGHIARAIAVDDSEFVYVTGTVGMIKYDTYGNQLWVASWDGNTGGMDIAVDCSDNVYMAGYSDSGAYRDYLTLLYESDGDTSWKRRYNGPANGDDYVVAITVDDFGSVYVTGSSDGTGTLSDCVTIKYVQFLRGDVNHDKKVAFDDIISLVSYLFKRGPTPVPIQSGDANCDGKITIVDIVYLVAYLFKGGPPPCK